MNLTAGALQLTDCCCPDEFVYLEEIERGTKGRNEERMRK